MLELSGVTRTAGRVAIFTRASFEIAPGRPTAIAGLSAPGREALARLLTGVDKPQAGTVRLGGVDVTRVRREKGRIVRIGPAIPSGSGQKVGQLIGAEEASRAGLSGQLETKASALLPDQRMRLAIAVAVAEKPDLLILDAPAGLLSDASRDLFANDLALLVASARGVTVLLASGADEALGLGGDIVVMSAGAVVQRGLGLDVSARPVSLSSATATSWPMLNTLPMMARDGRGVLADGSSLQPPEGVNFPEQGACTLAFHPEDVTLERASPGCVRFVVRAGAEESRGVHRFLRVEFAGASWLCPIPTAAPHAGALLNAFVDRSRLMLFDAAGQAVG